ncbi:hypothetical protein ABKU49_05770 [Enterobacter hormaechei]
MNKIPHEKPMFGEDTNGVLRRNPNNITIRQHIISAKHLESWSSDNKTVFIQKIYSNNNADRFIPFNNELFCVLRLWDQGCEADFKLIEDKFHTQLDLILKDGLSADVNYTHLVDYYKSVVIRCCLSRRERPHYEIDSDLAGEHSKEQLERIEWESVDNESGFVSIPVPERADSQSLSRSVVRMTIDMMSVKLDSVFANTSWEILHLEEHHENLCISDAIDEFHDAEIDLLPLSPRILLVSTCSKSILGNALKPNVINGLMLKFANRFCIQ